jgi:predicted acylesterase/phospholipase RssA
MKFRCVPTSLVTSVFLLRTLWFADARALLALLIVLAVGACAQLDRVSAVPAADTGRASVAGISEARFLASDTVALAAFGRRLHERESKYFSSLGKPIPSESLLAISGGGDNGAFGAGVLVGWSESRTRPSFKIVTGISTGALIAPLVFVGPEYDPLLAEMYTTIGQSDIFQERPVLAGLVSDALADSRPLQGLVARYVDANLVARIAEESRRGRALVIITTNLDAGVPVIWNIGAIAESERPEAIGLIRKILLASASIPGFFPPVMFDVVVDGVAHQEMHVDGGASMQTFLYPAALQVREIPNGGVSRPRTAYVIRNGRLTQGWDEVARSTPAIATRALATLTTNSGVGDLYRIYALAKRDGVRLQLAYIEDDFEQPHSAEFDRQYMVKLFEYGHAKARAGYPWRSAPPGF